LCVGIPPWISLTSFSWSSSKPLRVPQLIILLESVILLKSSPYRVNTEILLHLYFSMFLQTAKRRRKDVIIPSSREHHQTICDDVKNTHVTIDRIGNLKDFLKHIDRLQVGICNSLIWMSACIVQNRSWSQIENSIHISVSVYNVIILKLVSKSNGMCTGITLPSTSLGNNTGWSCFIAP
jgi:hypothetical protein